MIRRNGYIECAKKSAYGLQARHGSSYKETELQAKVSGHPSVSVAVTFFKFYRKLID